MVLRIGLLVAVNLLLWLGCAGVGLSIVSARAAIASADARGASDSGQGRPPSPWSRIGLAACIGLAALLALGSVSTVLAVPMLPLTWLFIGCGLALLAWRFAPGLWARLRARPGKGPMIWSTVVVGTLGLMLLVQAILALGMVFPNPCDDLLAYIPMAQRLVDTGQVIEPWSFRRLQHLGGQPFLQAFPIATFGYGAFAVTDTLTASAFLAGLFAAGGFRRVSSRMCCVAVILAVPMLSVPRGNSATVLLAVPLLTAGFLALRELRAALTAGDGPLGHRWAAAGGLLLAAGASLRAYIVLAAGAVLVIGILTASKTSWRARVKTLSIGVATAIGATAGWALGSWQSSGTPAFPIIGGNVNPDIASSRDPGARGVLDNIEQTLTLLQVGTYGPYIVAVLAVLVLAIATRRWLPDARLIYIVGGATLGNIIVLATFLTLAADGDFPRYVFPIVAAPVVFYLHEAIRGTESIDGIGRAASVRPLLLLAPALLVFAFVFAPSLTPYESAYAVVRPGLGGLSADGKSHGVEAWVASPELRSDYRQASQLLRGHGRAIAAVDRPYLLDYRTDDIESLDLVGWAAPGGDFPLFGSALDKIRLLRSQGYEQLLATVPEEHACTNPGFLQYVAQNYPRPGPLLASYHRAWVDSLIEIVERAPGAIQRVGTLLLIDMAVAESALTESP